MTEPTARQESGNGAPTNGAPLSAPDDFVITDAPLPDHSASDDGEEVLSTRSASRTERLIGVAKSRGKTADSAERPKRERKTTPAAPRGGFVKPLTEMYGTIALMLMPFDAQCAMAIMEAAPKAAESLDNLAKSNDAVKRVLITLTQTSAWGAVLAAHAPIILAVTMHHVPAVKNSPLAALMSGQNAEDANA